ncbi:hypothetical protein PF005_g13170 [Phytophthora fragariae]|uniref:Uncharacterized protein n=1 Tax=Phytophthora fragariae TaxID=53985 RepID=A0A6A3KDC0_9STRA|nr:hypothetical protein PF003_g21195 [Phytophthora fragariae]KAE8936586.1 hypothetical protein PF009_g13498 [Phytophthora fragariae]KAE9005406.1 hypothetical protein PF011_g12056 [Phytophthora fragariae]KAE9106081.1 hypothetical protein PF010_g12754 [Phytophthora fragariae]KAE9106320.1 hypothetical protein PF007_g13441 [Phytophthora fragariae]
MRSMLVFGSVLGGAMGMEDSRDIVAVRQQLDLKHKSGGMDPSCTWSVCDGLLIGFGIGSLVFCSYRHFIIGTIGRDRSLRLGK